MPLTKAAGAASRCHSRSSSHDPRLLKLSAQIHVAWSAFEALESDLLPCVPTKLGENNGTRQFPRTLEPA